MEDLQCPEIKEITKLQRFRIVFLYCTNTFVSSLFSHLGLLGLVVAYSVLGGVIFMELELPNELELRQKVLFSKKEHGRRLVQHLKNADVSDIVLVQGKWSKEVDDILKSFQMEVFDASKTMGWDGYTGDEELQWSFVGALLYAITVITTIGYGHITPKTDWGRVVTILYAVGGIPLTLLCLRNIGNCFAGLVNILYRNTCKFVRFQFSVSRKSRKKKVQTNCFTNNCKTTCPREKSSSKTKYSNKSPEKSHKLVLSSQNLGNGNDGLVEEVPFIDAEENAGETECSKMAQIDVSIDELSHVEIEGNVPLITSSTEHLHDEENDIVEQIPREAETIPIKFVFSIVIGYIIGGALLFTAWEDNWDFLIGFYFCFITLTTIGFGDFVPGTSVKSWSNQGKTVMCGLYLMFGLALMSMAFQLVQQDVNRKFRELAMRIGLLDQQKKTLKT